MKTKNGKVKLEKGEVRVGNFFFKTEKEHIKVQDMSSMVSFRISRSASVGMWVSAMIERGKESEYSLHIYAATMFALLLSVPDNEFVEDVNSVISSATNRHPEYYGIKKEDLSDEEQERIVEEEREKAEFEDQIKGVDDGDTASRQHAFLRRGVPHLPLPLLLP